MINSGLVPIRVVLNNSSCSVNPSFEVMKALYSNSVPAIWCSKCQTSFITCGYSIGRKIRPSLGAFVNSKCFFISLGISSNAIPYLTCINISILQLYHQVIVQSSTWH